MHITNDVFTYLQIWCSLGGNMQICRCDWRDCSCLNLSQRWHLDEADKSKPVRTFQESFKHLFTNDDNFWLLFRLVGCPRVDVLWPPRPPRKWLATDIFCLTVLIVITWFDNSVIDVYSHNDAHTNFIVGLNLTSVQFYILVEYRLSSGYVWETLLIML